MAQPGRTAIALPAVIDLDALDAIRDGLSDALEVGGVRLDASGVERVATNGLFLLLSAAETARRHRFDFAITEPSAPLLAAIARLGLGSPFEGLIRA
jgi:anti-anti-sigma regulatory factor